jgi:hypothetical protein
MRSRRAAATTAALGLVASAAVAGSLALHSDRAGAATQWTGTQLLQPYRAWPEFSEYQVMSFSTPFEESVAIWSDGQHSLLSATRSRDGSGWSTPVTIASDGEFLWHYIQGTDPTAAMAPSGDITVAWTNASQDRIEVTTQHAGIWWSAPTTVATGSQIGDVHISYGPDNSAALVWTDGSAVFASLRPAAYSPWSAPITVSDPVVVPPGDSTPLPLLQDPRVAVGSDGRVVVTWGAYDGDGGNLGRFYRVRASTLPAGSSRWTTPEWVSLPNEVVLSPQLQAAGDGSLLETWLANDGTASGRLRWSRLDADGWSTPGDLGSNTAGPPSLAFGPGGSVTAAWIGYAGPGPVAELRVAGFRPDTGWSPTTVLATGVDSPHLVATADGTPTAAWRSCDVSGALPSCTLQLSTLTAGTWSAPVSPPTVDSGLSSYALSSSPTGQLNVVYDDQVPNPQNAHGKFQIQSAWTIRPQLSVTVAPMITGSATVGGLLTATTGSWAQPPSSVVFQWWRNGIAIPTMAHQTYRPVLADAGQRLSVTVTGHLDGYRDAVVRSVQVTVARPPIRNLVKPSITGTTLVGQVLVSHVGTWTPTPAGYGYQWLRDGRAIPGATRYAYRLVTADRGHAIAVRVTAVRSPYLSTSAGSWPVRPR